MRIDVDVSGEEIIARSLLRTSRRASNVEPALVLVGELLEELVQRNFATQGAAGGAAWKPLADSTVRQKAAAGQSSQILRATGDLLASLTGGPGHIRHVGPHLLVFGSGVEYGAFHQKGKGVPQRKPVQLTETHKRQATKIIQRFLVTGEVGRSR